MIFKHFLIISFILVLASAATAGSLTLLKAGSNASGGGGGCSNSLNFSQSCNSQYIPLV